MKRLSDSGFSLIELSIGLIILGLFASAAILTYKSFAATKRYEDIQSALFNIRTALNGYYFENGRYPCPADITLQESHPDYGKEVACSDMGVELCSDGQTGICRTSGNSNRAIIGAVPTVALKIPSRTAIDPWTHKITYAVTQRLTDPATFDNEQGTIRIDRRNDVTWALEDETDKAHFMLVIHGESAIGAYTSQGELIAACEGAGTDLENCDNDQDFLSDTGGDAIALAPGPDFFDDFTSFQENVSALTWFSSPVSPVKGMTLAARIGIGTFAPRQDVNVIGDVKVNDAIRAHRLCDENGGNCFNSDRLTGSHPLMRCRLSNAVTGITDGRVICGHSIDTTEMVPETCPPRHLVKGFTPDGRIICEEPE